MFLEGRLGILKTREPHSGPPRSTTIRGLMALLDFDQGDFLLALEVDYKLPESGLLLDVHGRGGVLRPPTGRLAPGNRLARANQPAVRAKALKLLDWDAYLVISGSDLELAERIPGDGAPASTSGGSGVHPRRAGGLDRRRRRALVQPVYILEVSLHGEASVKVFGIGFELMLDALLALEAPVDGDDEFFGGKVQIKLGLPWPLPDIKKDILFEWGDASGMPPPITPLVDGECQPRLQRWGNASTSARPAPSPACRCPSTAE